MWNRAKWLKVPEEEIRDKNIYAYDMTGRFAYFRYEVNIPGEASLVADISANARYRLWVNGQSVLSGPCKGDRQRQYYETVELTEYLIPGKNVFCAQVLCCDPETASMQTDERASIYGVISHSCGHRFAMEGDVRNKDGEAVCTVTTGEADWRVFLDSSYYLKSTDITTFLGAVTEDFDMAQMPWNWKSTEFDMSYWKSAEPELDVVPRYPLYVAGVMPRFRMREREIPNAYEMRGSFVSAFCVPSGEAVRILNDGYITVPAGTTEEFILDAGYIQSGFPAFRIGCAVAGTKLQVTYFEKFGGAGSNLKRTDYVNGKVEGLTDTVVFLEGEASFEPFWVRCFRFIRITVTAADEPATLYLPTYKRTAYPLETRSDIQSSETWVGKLWEMCVRTLENCMLETYMDCPYYEQLQFAMDTRLEALYTYAAAADPRMAKKALIDFHYGMLPEGLTPGKYPSVYLQVLSTFSLHYIMMAWEYYRETGDRETARFCLTDADRVLDYYDSHRDETGLVAGLEYWAFVDWLTAWNQSAGMPEAVLHGPSTIINLMYAYALDCAQKLANELGRTGLAIEYADRRREILGLVEETCWSTTNGMYREGPAFEQYTCHAQAWAVLCGLKTGDDAEKLLTLAAGGTNVHKCTFSTSYEWFRALETAGMYSEMRIALKEWVNLIDLECTCCPETPVDARSDCHAWSALPMYEMVRTMAGVRSEGIAWESVIIEPHLMGLEDIRGVVATPRGDIGFDYSDGHRILDIPDNMQVFYIHADGKREKLHVGKNDINI